MRTTSKVSLILGLFTLVASCDAGGPEESGPGFGFGDAGDSGRIVIDPDGGGREAAATDGPSMVEGIDVEVAVTKPGKDAIVTYTDSFKPEVVVDVMADTDALLMGFSITDVKAEILVPDDMTTPVSTKLSQVNLQRGPEGMRKLTYTFGNTLVGTSGIPSGNLQLKITVTTNNTTHTAMLPFRFDGGPTIKFIVPSTPDTSFKDSAPIKFSVSDSVFPPVSDVKLFLGDAEQELQTPDGVYAATIDFKSFVPRLSGRQLVTVRAKNGNGTSSVVSLAFIADDQGPVFTKLTPQNGQLIGGIIEIVAELDDPAGVDPASVVAVIGNGDDKFEVRLTPPAVGMSPAKFTKAFDTRLLPTNAIYPSLSMRASDKLGNESTIGYNLSLDNMPPLLDLDPPDDFRFLTLENGFYKCSWPLDPVGPDAVDDGQYVNQAFDVRVRAEDQGNEVKAGTIDFVPLAGLKAVQLVALDDTSRALVVDTDGDKICDAVNPLLVPTTRPMASNQILLLDMDSLARAGVPDKNPELPAPGSCTTNDGTYAATSAVCDNPGVTFNASKGRYGIYPIPGNPPLVTLHSAYMTNFTTYAQDNWPAIWTLGPIRPGLECAGRQLESVGTNLSDGWVCLAALGEDNLGRKQVSRPIRVCIDADASGGDCPHISIVAVSSGSPMAVTTAKNHGFVTGDEVFVQGVECQTGANGKRKITVTGPTTFTLNGVAGISELGCTDSKGLVVATKLLPDCTGKQTAPIPNPTVDNTVKCDPWRTYKYPTPEFRIYK
ncbi:MAG: hypothetical protein SF187_00410 [Deltaproteobacteria bacterium]|nr:hypothetical protein [Deltaproteobacteria bacterium]